ARTANHAHFAQSRKGPAHSHVRRSLPCRRRLSGKINSRRLQNRHLRSDGTAWPRQEACSPRSCARHHPRHGYRSQRSRHSREQFGVAELTGFGLDDHPQALSAAGAIIHYLRENAARGDRSGEAREKPDAPSVEALGHLDRVRYYEHHDTLVLDPVSVRNLELLTPIFSEETGRSSGPATLIAALDVTVTGMGARLLRTWLLRPLLDRDAIEARLAAVTQLVQQTVVRGEIRKELRGILDLERLTSRITLGLATPRELVALRKSLGELPVLKNFVTPPPVGGSELLRRLHEEID